MYVPCGATPDGHGRRLHGSDRRSYHAVPGTRLAVLDRTIAIPPVGDWAARKFKAASVPSALAGAARRVPTDPQPLDASLLPAGTRVLPQSRVDAIFAAAGANAWPDFQREFGVVGGSPCRRWRSPPIDTSQGRVDATIGVDVVGIEAPVNAQGAIEPIERAGSEPEQWLTAAGQVQPEGELCRGAAEQVCRARRPRPTACRRRGPAPRARTA